MTKKHISYSELSTWVTCPYAHKLSYIDEINLFEGNEYTSFGKALHSTAEVLIRSAKKLNCQEIFELNFLKELMELKKKNVKTCFNALLIQEMRGQGKYLSNLILPELKKQFGEFEVLGVEEQFYEKIEGLNLLIPYNYKGFIDLIIKTKKENKIIILDYKSTSFGWYGRDRTEKTKLYQLIYYKYFYSKKYNTKLEDIETYFCLLKRTVKKDHIELYKVTSGQKRIDNAMKLLEKVINSIELGKCWKNKRSCGRCTYYNTEFCKR